MSKNDEQKNFPPEALKIIMELTEKIKLLEKEIYSDCKLENVYNMRWFWNQYNDNNKFYITFIDINGLKLINDTYGHPYGDDYIKKVCNILLTFGNVVRFGGDEFLIVTEKKEDFLKLKNIKPEIGFYRHISKNTQENVFTPLTEAVSMGFCEKPEYMTIKDAMAVADSELYKAKERKRISKDDNSAL